MWLFNTSAGVYSLPMRDCAAIARNAYRRICRLIDETLATAAQRLLSVPEEFAHTADWHRAEAEIDAAVGRNEYAKVLDLCADYERRATAYCEKFLEQARRA